MKKAFLVSLPLAFLLTGCPFNGYKYNTGHFPAVVTNFEEVNTEYDDYNATAPEIWQQQLLHFSSNRKSQGVDFDIVGENMFIVWDKEEGRLSIGTETNADRFDFIRPMLDSVNTSQNELGPYSIGYRTEVSDTETVWTDLMMLATDSGGDYDIECIIARVHNYVWRGQNNTSMGKEEEELGEVQEIAFLNTAANELYPCFAGESFYFNDELGLDPSAIEKIIWCNDTGGDFDIVQTDFNAGDSLAGTLLTKQIADPSPVEGINSDAHDKCPFANGELLVFTSDREGGFGGFDLYYCRWDGEQWGSPVNFGEPINSAADEYRPITIFHSEFDNTLLIFSSDREGGKGGFDLYYTGIGQMVRP